MARFHVGHCCLQITSWVFLNFNLLAAPHHAANTQPIPSPRARTFWVKLCRNSLANCRRTPGGGSGIRSPHKRRVADPGSSPPFRVKLLVYSVLRHRPDHLVRPRLAQGFPSFATLTPCEFSTLWECKVTPAGGVCQERNPICCCPNNDGTDTPLPARLSTDGPHLR